MKNVAIVGAAGAVGEEVMAVLERRHYPVGSLRLFGSERSAGKKLKYGGEEVTIERLADGSFKGSEVAFFSAGGDVSKEWAPLAANAGCVVVDNSSAFRMQSNVPLVVPEINPDDVLVHQGIIANPNCTTAITLMALYPLHKAFGLKRIFASSYQAVSGSGAKGVRELRREVSNIFYSNTTDVKVYPHQIIYNVIPQVDAFLPSGYTKEEMKMQFEGCKIMHHPSFRASVTCVRVPVFRAHSVAVSAEFESAVSAESATEVLRQAAGLDVVDFPERAEYPVPLNATGRDNCQVGRVRSDCAFDNGICFWICGDQLLKGAALNAVQIAELLV